MDDASTYSKCFAQELDRLMLRVKPRKIKKLDTKKLVDKNQNLMERYTREILPTIRGVKSLKNSSSTSSFDSSKTIRKFA